MKGSAIALFCAVALVHAKINENGCPINPAIDILKPHPNCNKYYQCTQGELFERKCASTLVFNVRTQECDWPENVDCENRLPAGPDSSEETSQPDNGGGNNDPSLAPEICAAEGSDGVLVAHENCNQFYQCHNGAPVSHKCASTLQYNPSTGACDWPENVKCGDRNPDGGNGGDGGNGESDNGNGDNGDSGNGDGDNGGNGDGDNGGNGDSGNGGNSNPGEAVKICAAEGSEGVLVAHENCNQFYKCNYGVPVALNCWGNLLFNPANDQCDWPENVNCGDRNPEGGNNGGGGGNGDSGNGDNGDGGNGDGGNGEGGNGDSGNGDGGNGDSGNGDGGNGDGGNSNPGQAGKICAAEGSDGILVVHENCNQFYKCSEGKPVAMNCPGNLLYNPSNLQCDWPENVNCADRTPDNGGENGGDNDNGDSGNGDGDNGASGGSGNGGNSNPGEAVKICAAEGSEGVLVAHENCNQFYKCNYGVPVALNCWGNLLFNPANDQCDWPENVNCGDRKPEGGNNGGGGGNGGSGHGDSGNGDNGDGGKGNGGNGDPGQAGEICAAEGSDGVLVAHENCNQFYLCSEGKPVAMVCQLNLLYNPNNEQCDWPENVNCADRSPDNGGENGGDNGGENGGDNGGENGGDNDNNNGSGGNSDPSQAADICAAEGSDGVLVAHENCNQFYLCSEGKPVAMVCQLNLLYNPSNEQCDWPENVNCADRTPDNGGENGGDNGGENGGDNGGENGGDNGNDNGSGGNSDPSQAADICAAEGSDGVLVAHENCNQFYLCSEGKPVAMVCQLNLLYNPSNEQCDWPENVNCADRTPDNGGENGGDNGGENGGDNGNDNGSGGNSDPSQAADICAAEGSDGVLVAHENCNQFYLCSEGKPVAMVCASTLLYNPSSEQCDWPENVNCGSRHAFKSFNKHFLHARRI